MARGLIGAAMLSGLGQGMAQASQTGMAVMGSAFLQKQRQEMENERMRVMEASAVAREQRGYAHGEAMQEKGFQHADTVLAKQQTFQQGEKQEDRGAAIVAKTQDRLYDTEEKGKERTFLAEEKGKEREEKGKEHRETLAAQEKHYGVIEAHQKGLLELHRLQYGVEKDAPTHFVNDENGTYAVTKSGEVRQLLHPVTHEPIVGKKDLSETTKQLVELYQKRSDMLGKLAADPMTPQDQAAGLRQESQQLFKRASFLLGDKGAEPEPDRRGGNLASLDAYRHLSPMEQSGAGIRNAAPAPTGEQPWKGEMRSAVTAPQEAAIAKAFPAEPPPPPTLGEKLSAGVGQVVDAGKGLINRLLPEPVTPGITKETPMQARAAVGQGDIVSQRQAEMAEREQGIQQPAEPSTMGGLLPQAGASIPPKLGQLGTETTGRTAEGRPIIKNPDGTVSTERTITEQVNGKWMNIPSMYGGKEVSTEEAIAIIEKNKGVDPETGRQLPTFKSMEEAVEAAKARSQSLSQYGDQPALKLDRRAKQFEPAIQSSATKYGVPPAMIAAIAETESNFDQKAVSKKGAKGLMQMMDVTAKEMGVNDPFDPAQSIDGGTKYFAQLLQKYDGNHMRALAAYNFGPANVDAGKEWPASTKEYVWKVMANANKYGMRY